MTELLGICTGIDPSDAEAVTELVGKLRKECEESLAALGGLEEEIGELEKLPDVDFHGGALADLEEKFKRGIKALKKMILIKRRQFDY